MSLESGNIKYCPPATANILMTADQLLSFEKTFEFSLLPQYLKEQYPHLSIKEIEDTIAFCLKTTRSPRTEEAFVKCVKLRLGVK